MLDAKWVTDDYYEDEALTRCTENGFTPYTVAYEDEIIANALSTISAQGRPALQSSTDQASRPALTLAPFYTLGGPTTHFAGSGADPWSEAGLGSRRNRLRGQGISEENWILATAEECRRIDGVLREYREERLKTLDGVDARRGWVYAVEMDTEKAPDENDGVLKYVVPMMERNQSNISHGSTLAEMAAEATAQQEDGDTSMLEANGDNETLDGGVVVLTPEEEAKGLRMWRWGIGGEWKAGVIRAAYEVGFKT